MTSEPEEAEVSGVVSAVAAAQSTGEAGTLLEVTFQRSPRQKYKYLEADPKILGVTEIALTVFFVVGRIPFYIGISGLIFNSLLLAFSCVGIISGGVAIAAQNLHLRTLKACLGMQVVTCVVYTFCLMGTSFEPDPHLVGCWHHNDSEITHENDTCIQLEMVRRLGQSISKMATLMGCSRCVVVTYQKWCKEGQVSGARKDRCQGHGHPRLMDAQGPIVNGAQRLALLQTTYTPSIVFPKGSGLFQQDNAPCHTKLFRNGLRNTKSSRCCPVFQIPRSQSN